MLKKNTINRYDKYKDSGIEWIGEIPESWSVKRLKALANIQTGNTPPKENSSEEYYAEQGFLWVKPDNLEAFNPIETTNEYLNNEGIKVARVVPANTPLICCIGSIGKFGVSNKSVAFNQQINAILFKKELVYGRFGLYYISSQEEQHWFYSNGNVVKILNTQNQGKIYCTCPTISEQEAIANYLDKKCGEIDRVVEVQKEVIEKLKEYKQSVITEAVTKGLDKSVPLKDSGIEWIGKIPQHWEIRRLKTVLNLRNEKAEYNGEIYIGLENVLSFLGKYNLTEDFVVEGISNKFYSGDLLFGKLRPYLAKATIVDFNGLCSSEFLVMQNFKGDNRYLLRLLLSYWFIDIVNSSTYGAKMPRASWDFISNMRIPFPSKIEQQQIADFLDKKCSEIDKIIEDKEKLIEKLTEYKKSLIYECVTGKRKVAV